MARIARAIHDSMPPGKTDFYPEQLDISFSFVPRMCAARNCEICLFGGGISKLCHRKRGIHCPVTFAACGYIHPCEPNTCNFKQDKLRGTCRSAIGTSAPIRIIEGKV